MVGCKNKIQALRPKGKQNKIEKLIITRNIEENNAHPMSYTKGKLFYLFPSAKVYVNLPQIISNGIKGEKKSFIHRG